MSCPQGGESAALGPERCNSSRPCRTKHRSLEGRTHRLRLRTRCVAVRTSPRSRRTARCRSGCRPPGSSMVRRRWCHRRSSLRRPPFPPTGRSPTPSSTAHRRQGAFFDRITSPWRSSIRRSRRLTTRGPAKSGRCVAVPQEIEATLRNARRSLGIRSSRYVAREGLRAGPGLAVRWGRAPVIRHRGSVGMSASVMQREMGSR